MTKVSAMIAGGINEAIKYLNKEISEYKGMKYVFGVLTAFLMGATAFIAYQKILDIKMQRELEKRFE